MDPTVLIEWFEQALYLLYLVYFLAEPEQWTQIQAPLKFYKLIVDELSNLYQNNDDVEEGSDDVSNLINCKCIYVYVYVYIYIYIYIPICIHACFGVYASSVQLCTYVDT